MIWLKSWIRIAIVAGLCLGAHAANAGLVTLVGNSINYVYEDTQAAVAVWGAPRVVGDAVRFLPGQHRAEALNGFGSDTADMNFIFSSVYTQDGSGLGSVSGFEFGDYRIIGAGTVSAEFELTIADNNSADTATSTDSIADSASVNSLQFFGLNTGLNLASVFSGATNDISLTIDSLLTATSSGLGEGAFIQQKFSFVAAKSTGIPVGPNLPAEVVPSPGVLSLFGVGLLALSGVRARSRPLQRARSPLCRIREDSIT